MFLEIAFHNLGQNKRRLGLTLFSIIIATTMLITFASLVNGVHYSFLASAINTDVGHVKIVPSQERKVGFISRVLISDENTSYIEQQLAKFESEYRIEGITQRARLSGILNTSQYQKSVILIGIQPEREKNVSILNELAGSLDLEGGYVGIGSEIARSLNIDVGQNITIQFSQDSFSAEIKYIFQTNWQVIDQTGVYIDLAFLKMKFNLTGISEIVIKLEDYLKASALGERLKDEFDDLAQVQIKTWEQELASIINMINMARGFMLLFYTIFLGAIISSIMLTTYMAVNERARDIGTLESLGVKPWELVLIFLLEATFIGIMGAVIGGVLGVVITYPLTIIGIDLTGPMGSEAPLAVMYALLDLPGIIIICLFIASLSIPGSMLPALKAARMDPVELLKKI